MTAQEVLAAVVQAGGRLTPHGEKITVEAPAPLPLVILALIREHKTALLALLAQSVPTPKASSPPKPLSPTYPCVVCGKTERWNDHGIWRCVACWPDVHALMHR
jgi:hypothetical protein